MRLPRRRQLVAVAVGVICAGAFAVPGPSGTSATGTSEIKAASWAPPPQGAPFDYQIGGDYRPGAGVRVVIRDWFSGRAARGLYSVCYVNAFQTQPDDPDADRPDERSNWPKDLVLEELADDPNWEGEYLVDIGSRDKRRRAAAWLGPMLDRCAGTGFRGVEFDNLNSWTRFDRTPLASKIPFGRADTVAYATLITRDAHRRGLAVAQKNVPEFDRRTSRAVIGFDFAIAEQCGRYRECSRYTSLFGGRVLDVEYDDEGFRRACASVGARISVVRRDVGVTRPGSATYRYKAC